MTIWFNLPVVLDCQSSATTYGEVAYTARLVEVRSGGWGLNITICWPVAIMDTNSNNIKSKMFLFMTNKIN